MRMIRYYAYARNASGRPERMLVTRHMGARPGECLRMVSEWTGHVYRSDREAQRDLTALNCTNPDPAVVGVFEA